MKIVERIVRCRLSDKVTRGRIKERVVSVKNALESRAINIPDRKDIQNLAISERAIVAPASIKQLVPLQANGAQPSLVFVIEESIAEIGNACARATRDELLKRVKWVKSTRSGANFRCARGARRRSSNYRSMGRDKDRCKARRLEIAGRVWREFIMRLYVVIKEVTIKLELIVTDLIVESDVAAPALLFWIGTRELVEVKAGQSAAGRSRRPNSD